MSLAHRIYRFKRRVQILMLRHTPFSWRVKRRLLWYLLPRFAVGVHAVLLDRDNRVLLLRSSYSDLWQLPGGSVEYGETLRKAMRREIREETGLASVTFSAAVMMNDAAGRGLHAVFVGRWPGGTAALSDEHTEWRWVEPSELKGFNRRCLDAIAHHRSIGVSGI